MLLVDSQSGNSEDSGIGSEGSYACPDDLMVKRWSGITGLDEGILVYLLEGLRHFSEALIFRSCLDTMFKDSTPDNLFDLAFLNKFNPLVETTMMCLVELKGPTYPAKSRMEQNLLRMRFLGRLVGESNHEVICQFTRMKTVLPKQTIEERRREWMRKKFPSLRQRREIRICGDRPEAVRTSASEKMDAIYDRKVWTSLREEILVDKCFQRHADKFRNEEPVSPDEIVFCYPPRNRPLFEN